MPRTPASRSIENAGDALPATIAAPAPIAVDSLKANIEITKPPSSARRGSGRNQERVRPEPITENSSPVPDRDFVMAGIQQLVDSGLARWNEPASTVKTLVLLSGERFVLTQTGIVRT
jgi:hypothetical protein